MRKCCVVSCDGKSKYRFKLPTDERRNMWINALGRKNIYLKGRSEICSKHFRDDDFIEKSLETGEQYIRKILKRDVLPSVVCNRSRNLEIKYNLTENSNNSSSSNEDNLEIPSSPVQSRNVNNPQIYDNFMLPEGGLEIIELSDVVCVSDSSNTDDQNYKITENNIYKEKNISPSKNLINVSTQTVYELCSFGIMKFKNNNRAIHLYTGLENYNKFQFVLQSLGPNRFNIKYKHKQTELVNIEDQFFITIMKLRRNSTLDELSILFDVSNYTISNIFISWINFMAKQWNDVDLWPNRKYLMPEKLKKEFPTTHIIKDSTEIPFDKPVEPVCQQVTHSTYKNMNTKKVLVTSTPSGLICNSSDAYGGSSSDRQLIEQSILRHLLETEDFVMKGKSQFSSDEVTHDRKIASTRVNIERQIVLTKTYKILRQPLYKNYASIADEINFVCTILCNFRSNIINNN